MASVLLRSVLDDNRPVQQRQTSVLLIDPSGPYQPCHGPYHTPHIPNRLHAQHTHKTPRIGDHSVAALQCIKRFLGKAGYCKLGLVVWAAWHSARDYEPGKHMWFVQCFDVLHHHITMNCLSYKLFWGPFIHGQVRTTWIIATMGSWGGLTPSGATNLYVMMSNLSSVCTCNCMI